MSGRDLQAPDAHDSGESPDPPDTEGIVDALFSGRFTERGRWKQADELTAALAASLRPDREELLLKFATRYPLYARSALSHLVRFRCAALPEWIEKRALALGGGEWETICDGLFEPTERWHPPGLTRALVRVATSHREIRARKAVLGYMIFKADQTMARGVVPALATETDPNNRSLLYQTIIRFSTQETDAALRDALRRADEVGAIAFSRFATYKRYDFLPDLEALRKKLEQEKNPARLAEAREAIEAIDEAIPLLVQAKREKAHIGLPPDWGS